MVLALDTQQLAAKADIQYALHLVFVILLLTALVALGLLGAHALEVQEPAQELALLEIHAQLHKQRLAGTAQQVHQPIAMDADTQLKAATLVVAVLDIQLTAVHLGIQHVRLPAFAIALLVVHAELGLPGALVLEVHVQEQERALRGRLALLQNHNSAGTAQQALTLTVLAALSRLREAT